jgi:tRNA(fMet)-specific endonuclease VapC
MDILLCSVVKAELWRGAEKCGNRERRRRALERLFAPFVSHPFDDQAAGHYADIRHQLEVQGSVIGPNDLKIAAIARAHGLTLVSADQGFGRVPGVTVEDWAQT